MKRYLRRFTLVLVAVLIAPTARAGIVMPHYTLEDMVRIAVAHLGEIRDPAALKTLLQALDSPHYAVRHTAAIALGKLGDKQALSALRTASRKKENAPKQVSFPSSSTWGRGKARSGRALVKLDAAEACRQAIRAIENKDKPPAPAKEKKPVPPKRLNKRGLRECFGFMRCRNVHSRATGARQLAREYLATGNERIARALAKEVRRKESHVRELCVAVLAVKGESRGLDLLFRAQDLTDRHLPSVREVKDYYPFLPLPDSDNSFFMWALRQYEAKDVVPKLHAAVGNYEKSWRTAVSAARACEHFHDKGTPDVLAGLLAKLPGRKRSKIIFVDSAAARSLALIGGEKHREIVKKVYLKPDCTLNGSVAGAIWSRGDDSLVHHHMKKSGAGPYNRLHVEHLCHAVAEKPHREALKHLLRVVEQDGVGRHYSLMGLFSQTRNRLPGAARVFYEAMLKELPLREKVCYLPMIAAQERSAALKYLALTAQGKIGKVKKED